jgi:O-methyltransferase
MSDPHDGMSPVDAVTLKRGIHYIYGSAVAGDVAEFGCYMGRTAAILAETMARCEYEYAGALLMHGISPRRLWVYDSFEGFPQATKAPDIEAPHIQSGAWAAGSCRGGSPQEVRRRCDNLLGGNRVHVGAGWFKDTLKTIPPDTRFAFVHLDCDFYESTYQVLMHLFDNDHLSDGCALYFDDWYCNRGSPVYGQQRAWREACLKTKKDYYASDWGPYGVVGHRFIVHRK